MTMNHLAQFLLFAASDGEDHFDASIDGDCIEVKYTESDRNIILSFDSRGGIHIFWDDREGKQRRKTTTSPEMAYGMMEGLQQ